jgi:hypothetical protein
VLKISLILVSCIAGAFALFAAAIWGFTLPQRLEAGKVLAAVAALQPGPSAFEQVQRLARTYSAQTTASVSGEGACSRELCELTFPFTNNPLGLLPGVRKISFGVSISVPAGRVTSVALAYQRMADRVRDMPEEPQYLYGVLNDAVRKESEYGPKKENLDSSGIPRLLLYRLGPHSTPADKTKAFALDLSCLDSFTGCSGPSAIYPSGWQSW